MNRDHILWHLQEAREELDRIIDEVASNAKFGRTEFRVSMEHLYHHVNTAWNSREASDESARECTEQEFYRWRVFPTDIDLSR